MLSSSLFLAGRSPSAIGDASARGDPEMGPRRRRRGGAPGGKWTCPHEQAYSHLLRGHESQVVDVRVLKEVVRAHDRDVPLAGQVGDLGVALRARRRCGW